MMFIGKLIWKIKAWFRDMPQGPDDIFLPLAKLDVEKTTEIILPKEGIKLMTENPLTNLGFYKDKKVKAGAELMHPFVADVMLSMCDWIHKELNIQPVVTETFTTKEDDIEANRVSSTHREGRAFDIRTRDWTKDQIDLFFKTFGEKYGHLGAKKIDGSAVLLVHHDTGSGPHFHVQFNRDFTMTNRKRLA